MFHNRTFRTNGTELQFRLFYWLDGSHRLPRNWPFALSVVSVCAPITALGFQQSNWYWVPQVDPGHRLRRDPTGNWPTFQQRKAIVRMYLLIEVMQYSATVCQKSSTSSSLRYVRPSRSHVRVIYMPRLCFTPYSCSRGKKVGVNQKGINQSWYSHKTETEMQIN